MTKFIAIVGWEGSGKSVLVNKIKDADDCVILPEMARTLMHLLENDTPLELIKKVVQANYVAHQVALSNKPKFIFTDRCILDPIVFASIFYPENSDIKDSVHRLTQRLLFDFNRSSLYDSVICLEVPPDEKIIKKSVQTDDDRLYSDSINEYFVNANRYNQLMSELSQTEKFCSGDFHLLKGYSENTQIEHDVLSIAGCN